jgi:hypothetical protein
MTWRKESGLIKPASTRPEYLEAGAAAVGRLVDLIIAKIFSSHKITKANHFPINRHVIGDVPSPDRLVYPVTAQCDQLK